MQAATTTSNHPPPRAGRPLAFRRHPVRPGGLAPEDKERIRRLADDLERKGKTVTAGPIARKIEKHPGTVWWFLTREGYVAPARAAPGDTPTVDSRGRKKFSAEEDQFLLDRRAEGVSITEIARLFGQKFEHKRTRHSLDVRLAMLAATED